MLRGRGVTTSIGNVSEIPSVLETVVIDRVCGEVLYTKYINNELPENLNVDSIVKQMSLGDTTVSYDTSQADNKVMFLIEALKNSGVGEMLRCRGGK